MKTTQKKSNTVFAIPLSEAEKSIKDYKEMMEKHFKVKKQDVLKAYLIHSEELLEAMGVSDVTPKYPHVRVYIGKKQGDYTNDMKLFVTPADENGKDIILEGPINDLGDSVPYVFDLNAPCPNACDTSSPLYNA
jgi:hypothetical protein